MSPRAAAPGDAGLVRVPPSLAPSGRAPSSARGSRLTLVCQTRYINHPRLWQAGLMGYRTGNTRGGVGVRLAATWLPAVLRSDGRVGKMSG